MSSACLWRPVLYLRTGTRSSGGIEDSLSDQWVCWYVLRGRLAGEIERRFSEMAILKRESPRELPVRGARYANHLGTRRRIVRGEEGDRTMSRAFLPCLILVGVGLCFGQESKPANWTSLLKGGKCEEARSLCTGWMTSKNTAKLVEAHKCLANVALCGNRDAVTLQADDRGGGTLGSTYKPEAVDDALGHLDQALKLAPQDLSIHQGRLHLLEISFRYSDMAKALDESCNIYKGAEGVQPWLVYTSELFEERQFRASLALLEVLDKHYPDSHEVLGNIGAMHSMLKEDQQAIPYLRRAVELAPKDPIDAWDLGRTYDYAGKIDLADQWYQKALALESDSVRQRQNTCIYAGFVENKLHDAKRGRVNYNGRIALQISSLPVLP